MKFSSLFLIFYNSLLYKMLLTALEFDTTSVVYYNQEYMYIICNLCVSKINQDAASIASYTYRHNDVPYQKIGNTVLDFVQKIGHLVVSLLSMLERSNCT